MNNLIADFCKKTSLRGVRRIIENNELCLKLFWFTFVVGCTTGLTMHLVYLTIRYKQAPTIFVKGLSPPNSEPFPSMSICFNNIFSKKGYQMFGTKRVVSPYEYSQMLRRKFWPKFNIQDVLLFDSHVAYFQFLRWRQLTSIVHNDSDIFSCGLIHRNGHRIYHPTNLCILQVKKFWHSRYFGCFRLTVPRIYSKVIEGFFVNVINTKPNISDYDRYTGLGLQSDNYKFEPESGLSAALHEDGTFPDMEKSIHLKTGTASTLKYTKAIYNRLSSHCLDEVNVEDRIIDTKRGVPEFRRAVEKKCGCTPLDNSIILDTLDNTSLCLRIDFNNMNKSAENVKCMNDVLISESLQENLKPLCRDVSYLLAHSSVEFDNNDIRNCFVKLLYNEARDDEKDDKEPLFIRAVRLFVNISKAHCINHKKEFNMKEWVAIYVTHGKQFVVNHNEAYVFPFSNFISQLGGAASLWLGLTVTVFAEIIELTVLCIRHIHKEKQSYNTAMFNKSQGQLFK